MPNDFKKALLVELAARFGPIAQFPGSKSLFELPTGVRIYLRYSKLHGNGTAFYGLRQVDLNLLDGHKAFFCFFTDNNNLLLIPYSDFEDVLRQSPLASDGQYKVQLTFEAGTTNLYFPRVGHFNVDAYGGLDSLPAHISRKENNLAHSLSHTQAQTLLGSIGSLKGYGVYVPANNADQLDWSLVAPYNLVRRLPSYIEERSRFASEIDVIWIDQNSKYITAAFEVEHSTPIYSGLLRFNDVLVTSPGNVRYFVVSNQERRDSFARQLQRPTFQRSGLSELASFLDYSNVIDWHDRLSDTRNI